MIRGLFEGWHLVILVIVVLVLFGGKRLPDAARGLGRSLRIFKAEVKEMQEVDKRRPTPPSTPSTPEPLEGRVVDGEPGRAPRPSEQHRDI
ncbi:MAG TPA: Sec-independent protein translocase subunit TatA [Kineosporiaceae bacterium]|nr:Sec-independent protein translocase subunit TatA [Kineosporiaceae bacterium]